MSGGVDSSVSAALLKEQGFDVTGVFIKVWQPDFLPCNWKQERLDAMRVCAQLDMPFLFLDLEKEYKQEVIDYMIAEYRAGRTPNPDVMCNKHVKFGAFFRRAVERGADFIATGHYARVEKGADGKFRMLAGKDQNKDQSYFLWTLGQEQLSRTLFPVGQLEKPEVRALARKFRLPTAEKKDSQGLCFVGKVDMQEFLSHFIAGKEGTVINREGEAIGKHPGAFFFTIGERRGFMIEKKTPDDMPYYVVGKDVEKNTITVAFHDENSEDHAVREILLEKENWTSGEFPAAKKCQARARYRAPLQECMLEKTPGGTKAVFTESQQTLTPGQSLVVYDGEVCIGGGIIK